MDIRMNNVELKFMCCFCGKGIKSSKIDPCAINVMINFDKEKEKQYSQDFFCHIECFKNRIAPMVSLYIEHLGIEE